MNDMNKNNTVLRFMTCGSVDDGKSTLIGRLLYDTKTILTDTLSQIEKTSKKKPILKLMPDCVFLTHIRMATSKLSVPCQKKRQQIRLSSMSQPVQRATLSQMANGSSIYLKFRRTKTQITRYDRKSRMGDEITPSQCCINGMQQSANRNLPSSFLDEA